MDTKCLYLIIFLILISSCDPTSVGKTYSIKNNSGLHIKITLFEHSENTVLNNNTGYETIIKKVSGLGTGGFGDIGIFDSIQLQLVNNQKKIRWVNPGFAGFIEEDNNIGKDRGIGKDIYNKKYWTFESIGGDEQWIFTINGEDLVLFK